MTKKDLTEIVLIVDESGSMGGLQHSTIKSINEFLKEQRCIEGMARLTLNKFDAITGRPNILTPIYTTKSIHECEDLKWSQYSPRGMTPLFDAVGQSITQVSAFNEKLKKGGRSVSTKKADKYVIAIVTDGAENESREYNKEKISKLIKEKEAEGWHFVYLSANADAFLNAEAMGINTASINAVTQNYDATDKGLVSAYCSISEVVRTVRSK